MKNETNRNRTYFLAEQDHRWIGFLGISFILHLMIFSAVWWRAENVEANDSVYKEAIIVEPVRWAPEKRKKEWLPRKAPTTDKAPAPEAVKVRQNPMKKARADKKKAEEEEKKARETEEREKKKRKRQMAQALERIRNKANSWDGSPDGVKGAHSARAIQLLGSVYAGKLRAIFNKNWTLPSVIPKEELKTLSCKILVKIDRAGKIVHYGLEQRSGNSLFDSSAMKAVKTTSKVPLPDEMLQELVFNEGILINFKWKEI